MLLLLSGGVNRPNRLLDKKDMQYHARWGRYAAYDANNYLHEKFVTNTKLNKRFYKGDQWILNEDLETFFKDESGQDRNRLKIVHNIIRPMVEQYRGNAIRMKINFRAKSVSPKSINRREAKLSEMLFYTALANTLPMFADKLKEKLPIGKDESETKDIFRNLYVDHYVEDINALLEYVSNENKFEEKQVRIAEEIAFSGIGVVQQYEHNGHQYFELVRSEDYFFDRSCIEYDHSDAEYWGRQHYMNATDIYENYPDLTPDEKEAIEKYASSYQRATNVENRFAFGGKVPVIKVFWRDTCRYEYGYVKDEYGYPYLTKINFTYEGEEGPRYTDKDLIEVNSERARRVLRGKKKRNLDVDELRFCSFVPQEVISSVTQVKGAVKDIILDYGLVPYQETDNLDISNVKSPFKVYCWGYVDGEILSPVDDAISPQRFLNRLMSVAENQINNSRGSGTIYDRMVVDNFGGEEELIKNMNQSKPVGVNAKGRGIQNVIGSYDATVNKGTMVMFDIMNVIKTQLKDVTGLNEAIQGESMGQDQLVGVTQLMIQRGSLMQEPFYNAITQVMGQCFQSIATVGKRIYADNEREITIAVGDEGARTLKISKDLKTEDFRVFIKRENSEEMLVQAGNSMALTLLQLGFIDKTVFSNLYNRSTPDDVSRALRDSAKMDIEKQRMQQAATEQMQAKMEQQKAEDDQKTLMLMKHGEDREDRNTAMAHDHEIDKIMSKGLVDQMNQTLGNNQPAPAVSLSAATNSAK